MNERRLICYGIVEENDDNVYIVITDQIGWSYKGSGKELIFKSKKTRRFNGYNNISVEIHSAIYPNFYDNILEDGIISLFVRGSDVSKDTYKVRIPKKFWRAVAETIREFNGEGEIDEKIIFGSVIDKNLFEI